MKLVYYYIIIFSHPHGDGRVELFRTKKIKTYEDVKSIDACITKLNGFNCIVTDYKLLQVKLHSEKYAKDLIN